MLGLLEACGPRMVLTSSTTLPSSESTEPAPVAEPSGASSGTASLTFSGGVPSGAAVMLVTAIAPARYSCVSGPSPPVAL